MRAKQYAENSEKKVKWTVKSYTDWRHNAMASDVNSDQGFHSADLHSLKSLDKVASGFIVCKFITEVVKINSDEYPPNTIKELIFCL